MLDTKFRLFAIRINQLMMEIMLQMSVAV